MSCNDNYNQSRSLSNGFIGSAFHAVTAPLHHRTGVTVLVWHCIVLYSSLIYVSLRFHYRTCLTVSNSLFNHGYVSVMFRYRASPMLHNIHLKISSSWREMLQHSWFLVPVQLNGQKGKIFSSLTFCSSLISLLHTPLQLKSVLSNLSYIKTVITFHDILAFIALFTFILQTTSCLNLRDNWY